MVMVATSPKRGFMGRRRARPSTAFAAEHGRERAGFARALLCLAQVCPRGGDMHPAARPALERSFFQCLRWRQASCRTCFQPGAGASRTRVCLLGRLLQCGFPVRPISAVATSILPHLGKQFLFSSGVEQPAAQHALHQKQTVAINCFLLQIFWSQQ